MRDPSMVTTVSFLCREGSPIAADGPARVVEGMAAIGGVVATAAVG